MWISHIETSREQHLCGVEQWLHGLTLSREHSTRMFYICRLLSLQSLSGKGQPEGPVKRIIPKILLRTELENVDKIPIEMIITKVIICFFLVGLFAFA